MTSFFLAPGIRPLLYGSENIRVSLDITVPIPVDQKRLKKVKKRKKRYGWFTKLLIGGLFGLGYLSIKYKPWKPVVEKRKGWWQKEKQKKERDRGRGVAPVHFLS